MPIASSFIRLAQRTGSRKPFGAILQTPCGRSWYELLASSLAMEAQRCGDGLPHKMAESATEQVEENGCVTFCLPPLSSDDPLYAEKKRLMDTRELKSEFPVPLHSSTEEVIQILEQIIRTARILYSNEIELYFSSDSDVGPLSPRNELESLNTIVANIRSLMSNAKDEAVKILHLLRDTTVAMVKSVGNCNNEKMTAKQFGGDTEEVLFKWGKDRGVKTKLTIAYFEEAGRGAVALEDMSIGDVALEVPESLIISEDLVYKSDMFDVLRELDDITPETMLLLWSMRERFNPNSEFKIYFETLPREFNTGLNFGVDALAALEGTLLFEELLQSKEHLRQQFDALFPVLCHSHPNIFQQELYSWEKFLWACELWYSNSMRVIFADGKLRTCLVPVAGFLNHSLCPHVFHYGRVDPATKSLKFPLSRPCEKGSQCYLSYGNFPSSHFLMFYGFLPKGDNTFDVIPLDIDSPDVEDDGGHPVNGGNAMSSTHMVRGTWLSNTEDPHSYGLPPKLLSHLRAALKGDGEGLPPGLHGKNFDKENERSVLETILSIFVAMLEGLCSSDDFDRDSCSWDVKLALDYRNLQRRIISSIVTACNSNLRMLDDDVL